MKTPTLIRVVLKDWSAGPYLTVVATMGAARWEFLTAGTEGTLEERICSLVIDAIEKREAELLARDDGFSIDFVE